MGQLNADFAQGRGGLTPGEQKEKPGRQGRLQVGLALLYALPRGPDPGEVGDLPILGLLVGDELVAGPGHGLLKVAGQGAHPVHSSPGKPLGKTP